MKPSGLTIQIEDLAQYFSAVQGGSYISVLECKHEVTPFKCRLISSNSLYYCLLIMLNEAAITFPSVRKKGHIK